MFAFCQHVGHCPGANTELAILPNEVSFFLPRKQTLFSLSQFTSLSNGLGITHLFALFVSDTCYLLIPTSFHKNHQHTISFEDVRC